MSEPTSQRKTWLMRLLKLAIVALVVWGIIHTVRSSLDDLEKHQWTLQAGWLPVAGGLYLLGLAPSALFWHRVLVALGQRPTFYETMRAYYIGHLGKYVPGKAMVVVLCAGLIRSGRVDTPVATVSVFVETLTMLAVGSFLSAGVILLVLPHEAALLTSAVVLMIVSLLPTLPPIFRRLAGLALKKFPEATSGGQLNGITFRLLAAGWLAVAIGWCGLGLSLWATLAAIGADQVDPVKMLPELTAAVALAFVVGFVSLIPGGIGAREVVLAQVMKTMTIGPAVAVIAAFVLRLVWLVSELVISSILYLWKPRNMG